MAIEANTDRTSGDGDHNSEHSAGMENIPIVKKHPNPGLEYCNVNRRARSSYNLRVARRGAFPKGIELSSSASGFGSQPDNDRLESKIEDTSLAGSIVGEEKGSGSQTPLSVEEVGLEFEDESTESKAGSVIGDISPPPSTRSSSASTVSEGRDKHRT